MTRKSATGDMAKLVTGDSTRKQSINLKKRTIIISNLVVTVRITTNESEVYATILARVWVDLYS